MIVRLKYSRRILNYPSSSPSIFPLLASWRISSSFPLFSSPPSLGCASVGGNCFESFPSGDNENESKLKSKKLAGVNSNSISFQLEKQVEACLERTSMELQLRNEVARCKTIKKGPPLLPRDEPRLPLFYEHSRERERECVEWDRVRTTTLYKSKS